MSLDAQFFTPDTGDTVFCREANEEWTVACVEENGYLSWCGWPEGSIEVERCQLLKKANRTEKQDLLRSWAKTDGTDHRARYARSHHPDKVSL